MNDERIEIDSEKPLARDMKSGGVVNTSIAEFNSFRERRNQKKNLENRVKFLEEKV